MTDAMNEDHSLAMNAAIDEAFVYAFPLYEVARTRHRDFVGAEGLPSLPTNTVLHDPRVCDHDSRWVTTPNNDTLYSRAWIDLTTGPVRVDIDALPPDRYWSVAFMDAWTNNFVVIGGHSDGAGPASVTFVGPGGRSGSDSSGSRIIQAPGNDVWLLARWLVDPEGDPSVGQQMQSCMRISAQGAGRPVQPMPADAMDAASFVGVVCERMAMNPPPAADAAMVARIAALGLKPSLSNPWPELPEALRQAWTARLAAAQDHVRELVGRNRVKVQGWWVRKGVLGDFGTNYAERAAVALAGLAALPPEEAVYAGRTHDDEGGALNGQHRYCLTVPASGIDADAFWSLSMYEPTPDGRRFFVDNPIRRYTIGDRTPGLQYEPDGSLRIWIQREAPDTGAQRANWLPSAAGTFVLTLRAYRPSAALRAWEAPMPGVQRLV